MVTIDEVVEMWDKFHPYAQTEELKRKNVRDKKIRFGKSYGNPNKEALIRLSSEYSVQPWNNRTCYAFSFSYKKETDELTRIEVSFNRRIKEHSNTQKFKESLSKFDGEIINKRELILRKKSKNLHHILLKVEHSTSSSAEDICKSMEELIKLTRDEISNFLAKNP